MHDNRTTAPAVAPEEGGGAAEELAHRLRQQQLTAEYGHFALRTLDTAALLQEATRACALGLHSELCKAMEFLPEEQQFVVRAGVGWKPGVVGHARLRADAESPTGYAFRTGEPVISNDLEAETRFRTPQLLLEHGVKRAINVVVQGEGKRFGVLEVDSPTEGRFNEADVAFMQGFANLLGVAIERQQFEAALIASEARAQAGEAKLERALAHQEVLTREISHRVKNSLAIVGSLLALQGRMSTSCDLKQALADAQARVHTIAQVHDRLWRTDEVETISLAGFMGDLCDQMRSAAVPTLTLTYDFAAVTLPTDRAVPLALLVNELVTNAFKYACPTGTEEVRIAVKPSSAGLLRLEVQDQGPGLPFAFDAQTSASLGMKLIASLSKQLGGRPEWRSSDAGAHFALDFPIEDAPREDERPESV
ncbi:sensor histidine kinase [Methylopila sp. Yamaguchi]|uniref:sensor histidine kinase n=1 Tax=Methylopila sp. Yamaguchi TaxID=1437817 RepID=UPI000CB6B189|nr:histidine kinase dimerization/phosphoacceptor domain -containing protein [Methylopila sp. Yamaguchi]GBD48372.1 response regulator receiver protein [Methylopila sp. Yamaguchi]